MSKSKNNLTDFEILQLAATLVSGNAQANSNQSLVSDMFDCADLIRIKLGDSKLADKLEKKKQKEWNEYLNHQAQDS